MAHYFGSGERFKENAENSPGPGKYDPCPVEGFRVDTKSPFLGRERFTELEKEGHQLQPSSTPRQKTKVLGVSTDERQYSWATKRIVELQEDLSRSQKLVKSLGERRDAEKKDYEDALGQQQQLMRRAEEKEANTQASLNRAEDELAECILQLKGAKEALAKSERQLSIATREKEKLERDLAAQWAKLQGQVIQAKERSEMAVAESSMLMKNLSRLALGEISNANNADRVVDTTLEAMGCLKNRCEENESLLYNQEADLTAANARQGELEARLEAAAKCITDLETKLYSTDSALKGRNQELEAVKIGLEEELQLVSSKLEDERASSQALLASQEKELKTERAHNTRLQSELDHKSAEYQTLFGKAEVLGLELESLQTAHARLQADFEQYKQDARAQYERLTTSFQYENQLSAKLAADLKASQAECQRLPKVHAEAAEYQTKEVATMTAEKQKLAAAKIQIESEYAELHSQKLLLTSQISGLTADCGKQALSIVQLTAENAKLKQSVHEFQTSKKQQDQQLEDANVDIIGLQEESAALEKDLHNLQKQAALAEEAASQGFASLSDTLAFTTAAFEDSQLQLTSKGAALVAAWEQSAKIEHQLDELHGEAAELHKKQASLEAESAAARRKCQDLESELDELHARCAKLADESQQRQSEILSLEAAKEALSSDLTAEASAKEKETVGKAAAESQLKQALADIKHLDAQNAELKVELSKAEETYASLTSAYSELEQQLAASESSNGALRSGISLLQTEKDDAEVELEQVCNKADCLEIANGNLKADLEIAQRELAAALQQKDDAHAQIAFKASQLEATMATASASAVSEEGLQEKLESCSVQIKELDARIAKAIREKQDMAAVSASLKAKLDTAAGRISELTEQLEGQQAAAVVLEEDKQTLAGQLAASKAKCKALGAKVAAQEEQLQVLKSVQDELADLKSSISEQAMHQASLHELVNKHRSLQLTARQLQSMVTSKEEERAATATELAEANQRNSENATTVLTLREACSKAQSKIANLESEAQLLRDELEHRQFVGTETSSDLESLQGENLHLHKALRDLEMRFREAEHQAARKGAQVEALQEQLLDMEEEAILARSAGTETQRLTEENALLANQLRQMEINIQDLMGTQGLGHNNSKQRIQYHLRLKQELEEMRHECMMLLRERFHLEQCIRYLATRATVPMRLGADFGGSARSPMQKNPVQPLSLRKSHLFATPSGRASMLRSGRGVVAATAGGAPSTKAELVASIQQAVSRTATSFQELADDVEHLADSAATPVRRLRSIRSNQEDETASSESSRTPSEDGERGSKAGGKSLDEPALDQAAVERRIMAKILDICSPGKTGRTSHLMQQSQEAPYVSAGDSLPGTPKLSRQGSSKSLLSSKTAAKSTWK